MKDDESITASNEQDVLHISPTLPSISIILISFQRASRSSNFGSGSRYNAAYYDYDLTTIDTLPTGGYYKWNTPVMHADVPRVITLLVWCYYKNDFGTPCPRARQTIKRGALKVKGGTELWLRGNNIYFRRILLLFA